MTLTTGSGAHCVASAEWRSDTVLRAAITEDGHTIDAPELRAAAAGVASLVAGLSPSITTRIGLISSRRAYSVAAICGVLDGGAVAVPLAERPPIVGSVDTTTLRAKIDDADLTGVLADDDIMLPPELGLRLHGDAPASGLRLWTRGAAGSRRPHHVDTRLLVYTSGSTGRPKGVVVTASMLAAIDRTNRALHRWRPSDRFASLLPISHLAGLTTVVSALQAAVPVSVVPTTLSGELTAAVRDQRPSVTGVVPHQLHQLAGADADALLPLRLVVCSGAPLTEPLIARWMDAAPGTRLVNAYGLTEAFRSTVHEVRSPSDAGNIGTPVRGAEARIADDGQLEIRGPHVSPGYWPDAIENAASWHPTGDIAERARDHEGNDTDAIRLLGRSAAYLNLGGERVAREQVEAALDPIAPGGIAVTTICDDAGLDQLVVVAEHADDLDLHTVRRASRRRLAPTLRIHRICHVDALPRTPVGKLNRPALDELVATALSSHPLISHQNGNQQ